MAAVHVPVVLLTMAFAAVVLYLLWRRPVKSVRGKIVVITGAGHGLGRHLAVVFALKGARVVLFDARAELLTETANEIRKANKNAADALSLFQIDVANENDVLQLAKRVERDVGEVDILINNAGIVIGKQFLALSSENIRRTIAVNSLGPVWCLRAFLPAMIKRNDGHFVTVSSVAGHAYAAGLSDYCMSKSALIALHHSVRLELKRLKSTCVHSTLVLPWQIDTGMFYGVHNWWLPRLLFPVLNQHFVAQKIYEAVIRNDSVLTLPYIVSWLLPCVAIAPLWLADFATEVVGGLSGMDTFCGHGTSWSVKNQNQTITSDGLSKSPTGSPNGIGNSNGVSGSLSSRATGKSSISALGGSSNSPLLSARTPLILSERDRENAIARGSPFSNARRLADFDSPLSLTPASSGDGGVDIDLSLSALAPLNHSSVAVERLARSRGSFSVPTSLSSNFR